MDVSGTGHESMGNVSISTGTLGTDIASAWEKQYIFFDAYLFLRDRERHRLRAGEGQREREGDTESKAGPGL